MLRFSFFVLFFISSLPVKANAVASLGLKVANAASPINFCNATITDAELRPVISQKLKASAIDKAYQEPYMDRLIEALSTVSTCFSIDPVVFSALIGHESHFYAGSVSQTGAIGLGQLTTDALKEIAMQLHTTEVSSIKKSDFGSPSAKKYWDEALTCVVNDLSLSSFIHWWEFPKLDSRKAELRNNIALNLSYAAIIFKISYDRAIKYNRLYLSYKASLSRMLQLTLGYYNASSQQEKWGHYVKTRELMNTILLQSGNKKNNCYY